MFPLKTGKSEPLLPVSPAQPTLRRSLTDVYATPMIRVSLLVRKRQPSIISSSGSIPDFWTGSLKMISGNKLFLGLGLVPIAFIAEPLGWPTSITFTITGLSMLPLAGLLGEATEQVHARTHALCVLQPLLGLSDSCNHFLDVYGQMRRAKQ